MAEDAVIEGTAPAPVETPEPKAEAPKAETPKADVKPEGDAAKTLLDGDDKDEGAPEAYADFAMPEGMEVDKQLLEAATPVLKELGLSQPKAQKLVDMFAAQRQAEAKALNDSFTEEMKQWQTAAKSDKEFGGDTFDANLGKAKAALDRFGTPEFKKLLTETGLGNHPEIIRFAYRIGQTIKEDDPGGVNKPPQGKREIGDGWYSNESQRTN